MNLSRPGRVSPAAGRLSAAAPIACLVGKHASDSRNSVPDLKINNQKQNLSGNFIHRLMYSVK